jgi:hypothetical protein
MRTLRIALCILSLTAIGCRAHNGQLLLEQESRRWEDEAYRLSGCLEDCHAAREATIHENEQLKRELATLRDGDSPGNSSPSSTPAPKGLFSRPKRGETPNLQPPAIELPEPSDTPDGGSREEAPSVEMPGPGDSSGLSAGPATQLVINRQMTGGLDRDQRGGDEGLTLMVEPRDAAGELVKATGTISVVAMDPVQQGDAARVARWDFQPDELSQHFRNSSLAQGYQFELPWPAGRPDSRDLRLFVRYTSEEGRRITVDTPVSIRHTSQAPVARRQEAVRDPEEAHSARRPSQRSPASRLKSRAANRSNGDLSSADEEQTPTEDGLPPSGKQAGTDRGIRQAASGDRPQWKPFR